MGSTKTRPWSLCYNPLGMKTFFLNFFPLCLFVTSACGEPIATGTPEPETAAILEATVTATTPPQNDPCSSENLPDAVETVNTLMREFDDASQVASNIPMEQLPVIISNLQRIRRAAEDTAIPSCLNMLKTHQLNHMNMMIQTLIAFVGGGGQEALTSGLESARKEHDLYSLEIVRLLGSPLAAITSTPASSQETLAVTSTP